MHDLSNLSFGQRVDPQNGHIESWFTHGALDEIKKMDLSDKIIWMWGAGMGDLWLSKRCKKLYIVERVQEWIYKNIELQSANGVTNIEYIYRPCNEGSGAQGMYCEIPERVKPDIFIVDDAYRYECILKAIERRPCALIVDNWQQDYVFMCPAAIEAVRDFKGDLFIQTDHIDHSGNPWTTAIFYLK